jgi:tetratricopeptide (TPR) repeat protein
MAQPAELSGEIERHAAKLERDPGSRVFAQLADAYRKEGRLEDAIRICRDGLVIHPHYMTARVVLGRALFEQGALDEAEAEFVCVLERVPDNLLALRLLGDISAQEGRQEEARTYYQRVLRVNPLDRETQDRLASLPIAAMPEGTPEGTSRAESSPPESQAPEAPVPSRSFDAGEGPSDGRLLDPDLQAASGTAEAGDIVAPADSLAGAAPAERQEGSGISRDPLASPTLAALYASQGFAHVADAIYAQLGGQPRERPPVADGSEGGRLNVAQHAALEALISLRESARRTREARRAGQGQRNHETARRQDAR